MTKPDAAYYIKGILQGDIVLLSRAITLVESTHTTHQNLAQQIIDGLIDKTGKSFRLGITGVPGVGKSSFIEKFGKLLVDKGHKVAVLAIDPSSSKSKGSILGDKTRMEALSTDPRVFIRPSPSGGNLGGVTKTSYETILLCEAAGFDYILVETVGVGQSEISVSKITDFFLLLMLAGAGDELQGIKRGIMEMADALVITKADGDNLVKAKAARTEYAHAMHLFPPNESGWTPRALICSSQSNQGIDEVLKTITEYRVFSESSNYFQHKRKHQQFELFLNALEDEIKSEFYSQPEVKLKIQEIKRLNDSKIIQPYALANQLIKEYLSKP